MELEIAKDEQTILKCRDAIGQRREKISGYQERINDVKNYYKWLYILFVFPMDWYS